MPPCTPTDRRGDPVRTLHLGLRVADLDRSLAFYTAVGYEVVGEVPDTDLGHLTCSSCPVTSLSRSSSSTIRTARLSAPTPASAISSSTSTPWTPCSASSQPGASTP